MAKRILLVDDDALILRSLSSLLEKEGYEVVQANNGVSAIELAKEAMFDLVVTDVRMPGMNGLDTIKELQDFQKGKGCLQSRFMVITGFAEDEAPQRAVDLQITEFLVKPFDTNRFLQAVRDQLKARETSQLTLSSEAPLERRPRISLSIPNLKDGAFWFEKIILLKDTSLTGSTYFSNFALWQGELRELILLSHPHSREEMAKMPHIRMVTHSMYHRFLHETTFGDIIQIRVTAREIKHTSFIIVYRYFKKDSGTQIGEGWQRVLFVDLNTGRPCPLPFFIRELAKATIEDEKISQ